MSLSGNLGFVSLDEVLRLLNRSKQRGAVDVRGGEIRGRIFVDRGSVVLATMFTDEQLRLHLSKSGLVDGDDIGTVTAPVREMTVESIYQMGLHGESFEVMEEAVSPYPNQTPFDLEELLADTRQRLTDWAEVSTVVTDLEALIKLRRDLGDRDRVTIEKDSWRLLSEVGHGASVRKLAEELGTTEFWTARVAAGMIEEDLLALEQASETAESSASSWEEPSAEWKEPAPVAGQATDESASPTVDGSTWGESAGQRPETAEGEPGDDLETDQGDQVFEQPTEETPAYVAAAETDTEPEVDPNESWWSEPERAAAAQEDDEVSEEVEEDTEAFLEKVFSELEPTDTSDEGYGLLRRRRMGALRDFSNDA